MKKICGSQIKTSVYLKQESVSIYALLFVLDFKARDNKLQFTTNVVLFRASCPGCGDYVRYIQSIAPGAAAVVALFTAIFFFDTIFSCKRKGEC